MEIKYEHPLFCPVYILDAGLQGNSSIPKWEPRSRAGVYLGQSPTHAGSIAMVLHLQTGHVSCQYHLVFDDTFSTVDHLRKKEQPPFWDTLVSTSTESYLDIDGTSPDENKHLNRLNLLEELQDIFDLGEDDRLSASEGATMHSSEGVPAPHDDDPSLTPAPSSVENEDSNKDSNAAEGEEVTDEREMHYFDTDTVHLRCSQRIKDKIIRATRAKKAMAAFTMVLSSTVRSTTYCYASLRKTIVQPLTYQATEMHNLEMAQLNEDATFNYLHPLSFAMKTGMNETYTFHQAMKEDDSRDFVEAMIKELDDHHTRGHWKLINRSKIGNAKTIKAIWSFKRKRRPDGSLLKHKARLCAHGGMEVKGEHYWETYSPVVNWMSVRTMLIFAQIQQLHTRSIDFTLAFPQANVETTIYMEPPLGCSVPEGDYVLLLIKNLYGLCDASKTWFEHLSKGLHEMGFKSSDIDPCIFHNKGITILVYVDDCLIFCESKSLADTTIKNLMKNFDLTDEGELGIESGEGVSSYLGVQVIYNKMNGTIELKQPFLISRIIEALGDAVKDANIKRTPAEYKKVLHRDENGPERKQDWNYRSLIGMLNYLAASSRPDIAFAVHQAARFSANPKLIHEQAVKRIVRYLKGTQDKGIIMNPDTSRGIECFVDASFAGDWERSRSDDPTTVMSRTGFVILYMGCPMVWVSKMQIEIALSTTESEYIALSQAMRDVIPFVNLTDEIGTLYSKRHPKPKVICKLFEDNNGALALANEYKYRPRTKHIALKWHHFRSFVKSGKIEILPIDTKEQLGDQFTKALDEQTFVYLRYKLVGW
jgi:hypothetical protein